MMNVVWVEKGETKTGVDLAIGYEMIVYSGGTASNTTVNEYSQLIVYSGGTAKVTTVKEDGRLTVCDGAKATGITADSGAWLYFDVAPGTEVQGTYDGSAFEIKDSVADGFTIYDYCELTVSSGGTAKVTTVKENGRLYVSNDGTATEATVKGNGKLLVSSGGTATGITADAGALLFFDVAPGTDVQGTYDGSAFEIKDGIFDGGAVYNNCTFTVRDGGKATNTEIHYNAKLHVTHGGLVDKTTVNDGAEFVISSSGTAKETTVKTGGRLYVFHDGTASNTTVNDGGELTVSNGGIASNVTVKSNGIFRLFGKVTGRMDFDDGATISAIEDNGVPVLDFDLMQTTAGAEALVSTLAVIVGTPRYTLTVDGTQADGVYNLAGNAADFDKTITVRTTSVEFGTLTVGGKSFYKDGRSYTLAVTDSTLSITLGTLPDNIFCGDMENAEKHIYAGSSAVDVNVNSKGQLYIHDGGVAIKDRKSVV